MASTPSTYAGTFDPGPEHISGVLARRAMAFILDALVILFLTFVAYVVVGILGLATFGIAWYLFGAVFPVVALTYTAVTLGGRTSATLGMRAFGLEMRKLNGAQMDPITAAAHAVLFWVSVSFLTPFILLVALFNERRRLLHDFIIGSVVVNIPERVAILARR